jgi:hypothetical protein
MLKILQILRDVLLLLALVVYGSQAHAGGVRIIVDTRAETLTVMRGDTVITAFPDIAIGRYGKTYFKRQGDNKTPLGNYRIGWINRESRYYIFLGLTYPDQPSADRGLVDEPSRPRGGQDTAAKDATWRLYRDSRVRAGRYDGTSGI